jgi:Spy/CpxP family protein refolding chaperone
MVCGKQSRHKAAFIILILCSTMAIGGLAYAQQGPGGQGRMMSPKDRAADLKERLALSDSQTALITKIFAEAQEAMSKAVDSLKGDRQAMRDLRMGMMKKSDERIDSLLTSGQKKKYEELIKERRSRMRGRTRGE